MFEAGQHRLNELEDALLAQAFKNGDDDAFSALFGRYLIVIRSHAYEYIGCGIENDDLVQEGIIGLLNAAYSFDDSCGASFSTYARLCIDRNIITAVRGVFRKKQIPKSSLVCTDFDSAIIWQGLEANGDSMNPESVVIAEENLKLLNEKIFQKLTAFEQQVLELYLSGDSYKCISVKLDCNVKNIDNAIQRIRKKLR